MCLPTPFDFNALLVVVALSQQRLRLRVPSSPPILYGRTAGESFAFSLFPDVFREVHLNGNSPCFHLYAETKREECC
jgi:hypothetical protein